MKLTRCHSRRSWALVGAAALAVLLVASPETLAERSRGRGHERDNGRGHSERARRGGNGHGYGHRLEYRGHPDHGVRRHGHASYRVYRPHRYAAPWRHHYVPYRRPFAVPVRIAVVEPYRTFFVGRVYFEPHGHYHSVYEFPVHTSAGYVSRPHYYCGGELYRGNHVAYSDGRLSVAVRF